MMRSLKRALLLILIFTLIGSTVLAETYTAIVTASSAAVYSDAAMKRKVGTLAKSCVVRVDSSVKKALHITIGGKSGYVKASDVKNTASIAKPATINANTKIYQEANTYAKAVSVKKGLAVNVLVTQGLWAMIERAGSIAYVPVSYLTYTAKAAATATPKPAAKSYIATANVAKMYVYSKESTTSTCLGYVPKGKSFTVTSEKGSWAYIALNGHTGYALLSQMKAGGSVTAATNSNWREYLTNTSLSVEKRIAMYLMQEMKFSAAATSGILASVQHECSFHVDIGSHDGGYGIVQWTGSRNTRMKNWCKDNGYDHRTLLAQMRFLDYELNKYYPKVLKAMKAFPNTAQGAYDAGYYFCYNFEIPANRTNSSKERGTLAKTKFFPKYK